MWHNPSCSKSRAALKILEERGEPFQTREYLHDVPSMADVRALQQALNMPPIEWARTSDEPWLEHPDGPQVRPVGVPVVVLGHKWDEFEANFGEPEMRKVCTRALARMKQLGILEDGAPSDKRDGPRCKCGARMVVSLSDAVQY